MSSTRDESRDGDNGYETMLGAGEPDTDTGSSNSIFQVEKILDVRVVKGKKQYKIKWKGYSDSECSWEPESNVFCPEVIADFEAERAKRTKHNRTRDEKKSIKSGGGTIVSAARKRGYARGLEVEKIMGAANIQGVLNFIVKWQDSDEVDLVPAKDVNIKSPQAVIRFYEERISWVTHEDTSFLQDVIGQKSES